MTRGPLHLPHGSVRALLALCVVFVSCWLMAKDEPLPLAVSEALFTVLAYYFATRAHLRLPADELKRLEDERRDVDLHPLFLPKGTIRIIILLTFVGLTVHLGIKRGVRGLLSYTTLLLVLAFLAGRGVRHLLRWLRRDRPHHVGHFDHAKAALGVLVGAAFVALYVTDLHRTCHPKVHKLFLGFIIFYFGSR